MAREAFKTTDTSEYDPDSIWRGSADKQGHSAYFRIPVPKHWGGQINSIVQSDVFDYNSAQDFIRDAVYHRLHWAGTVTSDGKFLARLGVDKLQGHLEHYMVEAEGFREFMGRLDDAAAIASQSNDSKQFAALVDLMRDEADTTLREPFRSEAMLKLDTAFVNALDAAEDEAILHGYKRQIDDAAQQVVQMSKSELEAERIHTERTG